MTKTYSGLPVPSNLPAIYQGDYWEFSFSMCNPDDSPMNLTGSSFALVMRDKSDAAIFTPSVAVASNLVTFSIAANVTAGPKLGVLLDYDIVWTNSLGQPKTLFKGQVPFNVRDTHS